MRIVHLVHRLANPSAGPSYSIRELAAALAARGHDVTVMALHPGPEYWPDTAELRLYHARLDGPLGFSWQMVRDLRQLAKKPLIIHGHGLWSLTNLFNLALPASREAKVVISPHGMLSNYSFATKRPSRLLFWYYLQRPALRRVDCFHATSAQECADIRAIGVRTPVSVIPNGIDIPEIGHPTINRQRQLLYLGRFHPVKGLELLLSAWHQLEQAFPDWRLIIAGPCENAYGTKIKAMARELGCRRVEFPGAVFGETKQSAYASADLFILPSHSESFGLVVAEALARRVPVITTLDTPWHGLKKHGCGWCVESTEATILETLRIAMAKNPAELSKMGVRGRDWMEQEYSWARVTDMTVTTYQWLFQRGVIPKFINEK